MTLALQWQRGIFLAVASFVILGTLALPPLDHRLQLALLVVMVLLMGAPHGALDPIYVRAFDGVSSTWGWTIFGVFYALLSLLVIFIWFISPTMFGVTFLVISAVHFSGDPPLGVSAWTRVTYGVAVLALPALLHRREVDEIFAMLIGEEGAGLVGAGLGALSPACVFAAAVMTIVEARKNLSAAVEIIVVCALMTVAPPLVAFAVFFCGMHSPRHFIRTIDLVGGLTYKRAFQVAMWPMLAIAGGGAIGLALTPSASIDARLTEEIFIGLAALTLPHMLIVERLRFGWRSPNLKISRFRL
jgi:Brp/Blh family beta-carotene 15,15'-monooxygenase